MSQNGQTHFKNLAANADTPPINPTAIPGEVFAILPTS